MNHEASRVRNAHIVQLAKGGARPSQLARQYGITVQYVYALIRNAGVELVRVRKGSADRVMRRRAAMAELASLSLTGEEARRLLKVERPTFYKEAKTLGLRFVHSSTGASDRGRAEAMAAMFRAGKTLQEIGGLYGVSRERVRQIIKKHFGISGCDGGQSKLAASRRTAAQWRREAKCQNKHGCSLAQLADLRAMGRQHESDGKGWYTSPLGAFTSQRGNAKARGIEWKLKLWEWWTIWQESGRWSERGRGKHSYVMCRFGDAGAYEVGNVYIATSQHNGSVQPNNPYRLSHPDHEKLAPLIAEKLRRAREGRPNRGTRAPSHKKRDKDLPAGVRRSKTPGKFMAAAWLNGKSTYLGSYTTVEAAHQAYLGAVAEVNTAHKREAA